MKNLALLLMMVAVLLGTAEQTTAANIFFNRDGDDLWSVANNWSDHAVPTTENAFVGCKAAYSSDTCLINSGYAATSGIVYQGHSYSDTGTSYFNIQGSLSATSLYTGRSADRPTVTTVSGGGTVTLTDKIEHSNDSSSPAMLHVTGAGSSVHTLHFYGGYGASTTGDVLLENGGTLLVDGHTYIGSGDSAAGSVTINGGTLLADPDGTGKLCLAHATGSTASLTMSAGLVDVGTGIIEVGEIGTGTMLLTGGQLTSSAAGIYLGGFSGAGTGRVDLDGGEILVTSLTINATSLFDVSGGLLKTYGDDRIAMNNLIAANKLIAYNGAGTVDVQFDGTYTYVTGIPEPATMCLLGLGALTLIMVRRKRA